MNSHKTSKFVKFFSLKVSRYWYMVCSYQTAKCTRPSVQIYFATNKHCMTFVSIFYFN